MSFDYQLPPHLIAQHPLPQRDASRLMLLRRETGTITHYLFRDLPTLLNAGDLLVLNDTRVLPARLIGHREKTGGKWEGLFLRVNETGWWELLAQTKGKPQIGETILVEPGSLRLVLRGRVNGHWLAEPIPAGSPHELLPKHGRIPLPPYIRKGHADEADGTRYQTVFAVHDGSIAAPTAGLHFTPEVFEQLRNREIGWTHITLHVGLGTFEPMRDDDPEKHVMHSEYGEVSDTAATAIQQCKSRSNRVIAVGTTSTRTLETAAMPSGSLAPWSGATNIFIRPPYTFRVLDGLITNFHLPRTTLLYLVAAFAGTELIREAYSIAVKEAYRFYSYGDAMLIL